MEKVTFNEKLLLNFLAAYYEKLYSDNIPSWLIDINNGFVSPEYFSNSSDYENNQEAVSDIFDNVLISLYIMKVVENEYGEVSFDTELFEAECDNYIYKVRKRLKLFELLTNIWIADIMISKFPILLIDDVHIKIYKIKKSASQEANTITRDTLKKTLNNNDKN